MHLALSFGVPDVIISLTLFALGTSLPELATSIVAALKPVASDYLYFVARGDGSHQFSRTLEEHNAAVREYQLGSNN